MPLSSWFGLHWYGPAAGACVVAGQASTDIAIKAFGRANQVTTGAGFMPVADGTRLVNSPAVITGTGAMVQALPKARARAGTVIKIGALSQDDVTGAVLEAQVEGGLTLSQVLRILLAHAAGNATGLESSSVAFKSLDGSKDRIAGTISGGSRTVTTRDGS